MNEHQKRNTRSFYHFSPPLILKDKGFCYGGRFTKQPNKQTQKPQLLVQLKALTRSGYPECDVGILGDFPGRTDTDMSLFSSVLFPSVCPWKCRLVAGPGTVGPQGSTEEGRHVLRCWNRNTGGLGADTMGSLGSLWTAHL